MYLPNRKKVKNCKNILLIIFLMGLFWTGEVFAFSKPKSKAKTSCTISRSKFTVTDLIEYRYGIVAGENVATIKSKKGTSQDVITGFVGGVAAQIIWPKGFAVQPEVLYSRKGCMLNGGLWKYDIDYIEVPVKAMYRLNMAEIKPFVFAAPYGAYAFRITENGNVATEDAINGIKKVDFGACAGAGFDAWKFQISFKYSWGFVPVANETYPIRNRVFTVSAGLLF